MPLKWSCGSTVFALDFHPSRVQIATKLSSVLYEGLSMTSFLATTFQMYSLTCTKQIISVEAWSLDWISALEISLATVSASTERFPGLLFPGRSGLNTKQYGVTNL